MDSHRLFPDVCAGRENGFVACKNCFIASRSTKRGKNHQLLQIVNQTLFHRAAPPSGELIRKDHPDRKIRSLLSAPATAEGNPACQMPRLLTDRLLPASSPSRTNQNIRA
jgi:hypothetical protein